MALVVSAAVAIALALGALWWTMQRPGSESSGPARQSAGPIAPTTPPSTTPVVVDAPTIGSKPEVASIPPAASATPAPSDPRATAAVPAQSDPPATSETAVRSNPLATSGTAVETPPADATEGTKPGLAVPPTETVAKPPPRVTKKSVQPADPAQPDSASDRAECARIFQRLSLGESSPELLARLKTLKCR
jgi:hypothetical protein